MPGQRWRDAIHEAIRAGSLFIACFSRESLSRDSTYMNEELTIAIEELRLRPADRAWFIPLSLDGEPIPRRNIGAGETLADLQWIDLSTDGNRGIKKIATLAGASAGSEGPRSKLAAKAVRIGAGQDVRANWRQFLWSSEGVAAASAEWEHLFATVCSLAEELAQKAPALQIESECAASTCAIRIGKRSVVFSWLQSSVNEVEDARLYVLEYPWRYLLNGPNFSTLEPRKWIYQFAGAKATFGWSLEPAGQS